jgi:hypothetical protein
LLTRRLKGESRLCEPYAPYLRLSVCGAQRLSDGCKLCADLAQSGAALEATSSKPAGALRAKRCDPIDRLREELVTPSLLASECGETALLWP